MDDEIMKAIEHVARQAEQDRRSADIESYIRGVAVNAMTSTRSWLLYESSSIPEPTKSELLAWLSNNRERFVNQVGDALILLLRRELLT